MIAKRGLIMAAGALGAVYLAKFLFGKDIERYNRLAEMSGDKPLIADQIDKLKDLVGAGSRNGKQ